MFWIPFFYLITSFVYATHSKQSQPSPSTSAQKPTSTNPATSASNFLDFYGGTIGGNSASNSRAAAPLANMDIINFKIDSSQPTPPASDNYESAYPAILKKYSKLTNKCTPKVIIRHKIKKV